MLYIFEKWLCSDCTATSTSPFHISPFSTGTVQFLQFQLLSFKFLSCFKSNSRRFGLIEPKETDVLRDLEIALRLTEDQLPSTTSSIASSSTGGNSNGSSTCVDGDASLRPIVAQPEPQTIRLSTSNAPPGAAAPAPA